MCIQEENINIFMISAKESQNVRPFLTDDFSWLLKSAESSGGSQHILVSFPTPITGQESERGAINE